MNIPDHDDYITPDTKRLIIIDAHDTFLKRDFSRTLDNLFGSPREKKEIVWILRDGVLNFLEYFHAIKNMRLLAFLQDRKIYIQDCFAGADPSTQVPLRILTQTAWHNLLIRNMFVQASDADMAKFFPEYTIIHVPYFKAVPEFDGMDSEDFVLINFLRKVVIVGGSPFTEQIRNAVFTLLSYKLPQEDIIPIRCASNKGKDNDLALFFGEIDYRKSYITMDPTRNFIGDDYHGWSSNAVFNIEWGCRVPVYHMKEQDNPPAFHATHRFATLLVNVDIDEDRKLDFFATQTSFHANASFPLTHLDNADLSGISTVPKHVFIFQNDALGIFPPLARLSREQAVFYLLVGYSSHRQKFTNDVQISIKFQPLFYGNIFIFPPTTYAMLLWERMERSKTNCWLVNSHHIGDLDNEPIFINRKLLSQLIHGVYDHVYKNENMRRDPVWGFDTISRLEGIDENSLNPELAWKDPALFKQRRTQLLNQFKKHFEPFSDQLDKSISDIAPK